MPSMLIIKVHQSCSNFSYFWESKIKIVLCSITCQMTEFSPLCIADSKSFRRVLLTSPNWQSRRSLGVSVGPSKVRNMLRSAAPTEYGRVSIPIALFLCNVLNSKRSKQPIFEQVEKLAQNQFFYVQIEYH